MNIRTELSGVGNYVVCSIIDRALLENIIQKFRQALKLDRHDPELDKWCNLDLERFRSFGLNDSLYVETKDDNDPVVRLLWRPDRLADALKSIGWLMKLASFIGTRPNTAVQGDGLEVYPIRSDNGWTVYANFGGSIWDIIEDQEFQEQLPQINADIRKWWEDHNGEVTLGQYTTVFRGKDGPTLQVYQPSGSGLWICGCRLSNYEYQFVDHNTDHYVQAFSHVISLCIILKHCRLKRKQI